MKIVPIRNSVICRKVGGTKSNDDGWYISPENGIDMFEVVSFSKGDGFEFSVGDVVIPDGKGDEFETDDGETVYRFDVGKVMCRVLDP